MLRILICFFSFSLTLGCSPRNVEFTRYSDNGKAKPTMALIPLINKTPIKLPWNISDELTLGIRESLLKTNLVFLSSPENTNATLKQLSSVDPQSMKQFSPIEFVTLLELIEHREIPYERGAIKPVYPADGTISHVLSLKVRIQIVDIRNREPSIILHEILQSNHLVPESITHIDTQERSWGHETYHFSPVGIAHARLERDIAERLENYITVAKSL